MENGCGANRAARFTPPAQHRADTPPRRPGSGPRSYRESFRRIRPDKGETSLAYLGPFPVEKRLADIAHVPEAGVGCLGQTRDAPCADAMS